MKRRTLIILTTILTFLTIFLGCKFFKRLRLDYNSEGNYFDENSSVVYHEQAKNIYGIITFLLLFLTLLTVWNLKKNINKT
ncbi:MAG: hypothetical protein BGP13_01030 [Sphingobacteriales bacterium 40-81]|nr:MAG: hypothetical protein BGP13_01030 [Sphingobacteriales bacterium 40-81]